MEKSLEETVALMEAARLRRVVERLRHLAAAATVAGLHANGRRPPPEPPARLNPPDER